MFLINGEQCHVSIGHACPSLGEAHFWPTLPAGGIHVGCRLYETRKPPDVYNCGVPTAFAVRIKSMMVTIASA